MKNSNETKPQENLDAKQSSAISKEGKSAILNKFQAISICACGLLICFFLPWTQVWGGNVSGFDIQKMGGEQKLIWLLPISCLIIIFAGILGQNQKAPAQVAGILPFFVFAYWFYQLGSDLMHILSIGAYLSLLLGLILFVLSRGLK